jgi:hypothetical protein
MSEEEPQIPQEQEPVKITEELKKISDALELNKDTKSKKVRYSKMKVRRGKLKKGWMGVMRVGENGNASLTKTRIDGSAFDFFKKGGNYHSTDGREILYMDGKYPFIVQEDKKKNPKLFKFNEGKNEVYGQKNIIASILRDTIKVKGKGGGKGLLIVGVVIVIGYVLGKYVFKLF